MANTELTLKVRVTPEGLQTLDQVKQKAEAAERGFSQFSGTLPKVASASRATASDFAAVGVKLAQLSDTTGPAAAQVIQLTRQLGGLASSLSATSAAAGSGALAQLATTLFKFTPVAVAGGVALSVFQGKLKEWQAEVDRSDKKVAEFAAKVQTGLGKLDASISNLEFAVKIAGLPEANRETEKAVLAIRELGKEHGVAAGQIKATEERVRALRTELDFLAIAAASQKAGAKLQAEIRTGAEGALASLDKLREGLRQELPSESLKRLKALADELNFKGPVADLKDLDATLRQNQATIQETGRQYGLAEEFIRDQVKQTSELLKQRFTEAQQEAETIASSISKLAAEGRKILEERRKAREEEEKGRAQTAGAGGGTEEDAKRAAFAKQQREALVSGLAGDNVTGSGTPAGAAELRRMAEKAVAAAFSAAEAGDIAGLRNLQANVDDFLRTFGPSLKFISQGGFNVRGATTGSPLNDPAGAVGVLNRLSQELARALQSVRVDTRDIGGRTNQLLGLTVTLLDSINRNSNPANTTASVETAVRRATGNRGFSFGGF